MSEARPSFPTTLRGAPLSRIGLGTAALAGDETDVDTAVHRAIDLGINWIDTDAAFGRGEVERRIGRTLAGLPAGDRPFVATAIGRDWDGRSRRANLRSTLEPRRLRRQLEQSLSRLGSETADLVKLHLEASADTLFEDAWSMLLDLRQAGLIRGLGLIAPDSAHIERAERIGPCDVVHVELSLMDRRIGENDLLWRRPAPTIVAADQVASGEVGGLPAVALRPLRELLQSIAARRRATPAAIAAAWNLRWPGVASIVARIEKADDVTEIARATEIELSVRDLSDIAKLLPTLGGGRGPVHPGRLAEAA